MIQHCIHFWNFNAESKLYFCLKARFWILTLKRLQQMIPYCLLTCFVWFNNISRHFISFWTWENHIWLKTSKWGTLLNMYQPPVGSPVCLEHWIFNRNYDFCNVFFLSKASVTLYLYCISYVFAYKLISAVLKMTLFSFISEHRRRTSNVILRCVRRSRGQRCGGLRGLAFTWSHNCILTFSK